MAGSGGTNPSSSEGPTGRSSLKGERSPVTQLNRLVSTTWGIHGKHRAKSSS